MPWQRQGQHRDRVESSPVASPVPLAQSHPVFPRGPPGRIGECPERSLLPEDAETRYVDGGRAKTHCQRAPERHVEAACRAKDPSPRERRASRRFARFGHLARYGPAFCSGTAPDQAASDASGAMAAPCLATDGDNRDSESRGEPSTRERPGTQRNRSAFAWADRPRVRGLPADFCQSTCDPSTADEQPAPRPPLTSAGDGWPRRPRAATARAEAQAPAGRAERPEHAYGYAEARSARSRAPAVAVRRRAEAWMNLDERRAPRSPRAGPRERAGPR